MRSLLLVNDVKPVHQARGEAMTRSERGRALQYVATRGLWPYWIKSDRQQYLDAFVVRFSWGGAALKEAGSRELSQITAEAVEAGQATL
jgi:hypothetical protein